VIGIVVGPARHRSRSGEAGGMSGSIDVTDKSGLHCLPSSQGLAQIPPVGFSIIGILHPFFLSNNSVLTFIALVAS